MNALPSLYMPGHFAGWCRDDVRLKPESETTPEDDTLGAGSIVGRGRYLSLRRMGPRPEKQKTLQRNGFFGI
ncbi:hypothetical protein R1flu_023858 [Riccia fluitans]|uniref:Uncharacterized protein n=1 Tax=Riccia fluitans TaxID=41844 RepID=A0ABD1XW63_9MARC